MNRMVGYFYAAVSILAALGAAIHSADVIVEYQSGTITGAKAAMILVVMVVVIFLLVDFATGEIGVKP